MKPFLTQFVPTQGRERCVSVIKLQGEGFFATYLAEKPMDRISKEVHRLGDGYTSGKIVYEVVWTAEELSAVESTAGLPAGTLECLEGTHTEIVSW